jgi:hypothetical protein
MTGCLWIPNKGSPATTVGALVNAAAAHHKMCMNEQTFSEFDWSPLGEGWWLEAQKTCNATDLQVRFCCARTRGMTASGAAKAAGYTGDATTIRQAGSRAAKSTAVMNMAALAAAEGRGGDDGTVGPAEARRILSRLARGSDPSVRIRAVELLAKLEREDREFAAMTATKHDPIEELRLIAQTSPQFAALLARDSGIPWDDEAARPMTNGAHARAADEDGAFDADAA